MTEYNRDVGRQLIQPLRELFHRQRLVAPTAD